MSNILVVYGTRPEEIKLYPFTKYTGFKFCEVDQSPDLHQKLIKPDFECSEYDLEYYIKSRKAYYSAVMVQGDTRTTFRAAIAAFENKIPVIHIEAGMRTFDLTCPFPEEGYRQMIDCIATYKYCSTYQAQINILQQDMATPKRHCLLVGQTGIDTLMEFAGEITDQNIWLVTVHRREANMPRIIKRIKELQKDRNTFIFAHPNPQGQELTKYFSTNPPAQYKEFVKLLAQSTGVITDSGGLVEEALALGKQVIQLREKTERPLTDEYKPGATKLIVEDLKKKGLL